MAKHNDYCILLAGGVGKRLWPTSRRNKPKQFIDFFGTGQTLLQQTYERVRKIIPAEHIYISTFVEYEEMVKAQLPELTPEQILSEPVQLSTAPATAWATHYVRLKDPEANVLLTPCDQLIVHEERYLQQIEKALQVVSEKEVFLSLGVAAQTPNTAYGYIQMGKEVDKHLYKVQSFLEKPDIDYAARVVDSGEFLWNTGSYIYNVKTFDELLHVSMPELAEQIESIRLSTPSEEVTEMQRLFPSNKHRSIDLVILEKCEKVLVMQCDFGWSDIGCWPEMYQKADKDEWGNAVIGGGKVMLSDTHNTIISLPEGQAAVVRGLDHYVVAQKGNVVLVCPNDDPSLAKTLFKEAEIVLGEKYT